MGLRKVSHVDKTFPGNGGAESRESTAALLRELVAHLRENRTPLREEWVRRITESKLLMAMTRDEIFTTTTLRSWSPEVSRPCKRTRATSRNALSHEESKPTR